MFKHLSPKEKVDIIRAYTVDLETMINLSKRHGVSRASIYKMLRKAGVDTTKRKIEVSCTTCGESTEKHKSVLRRATHIFCCSECYHAFLDAGNGMPYRESRNGQRIARAKVSEYIELKDGYLIHHEDRNCWNNELSNLRVFRTQGDHIRYHRLGPDYVTPLWDGSTV